MHSCIVSLYGFWIDLGLFQSTSQQKYRCSPAKNIRNKATTRLLPCHHFSSMEMYGGWFYETSSDWKLINVCKKFQNISYFTYAAEHLQIRFLWNNETELKFMSGRFSINYYVDTFVPGSTLFSQSIVWMHLRILRHPDFHSYFVHFYEFSREPLDRNSTPFLVFYMSGRIE